MYWQQSTRATLPRQSNKRQRWRRRPDGNKHTRFSQPSTATFLFSKKRLFPFSPFSTRPNPRPPSPRWKTTKQQYSLWEATSTGATSRSANPNPTAWPFCGSKRTSLFWTRPPLHKDSTTPRQRLGHLEEVSLRSLPSLLPSRCPKMGLRVTSTSLRWWEPTWREHLVRTIFVLGKWSRRWQLPNAWHSLVLIQTLCTASATSWLAIATTRSNGSTCWTLPLPDSACLVSLATTSTSPTRPTALVAVLPSKRPSTTSGSHPLPPHPHPPHHPHHHPPPHHPQQQQSHLRHPLGRLPCMLILPIGKEATLPTITPGPLTISLSSAPSHPHPTPNPHP